MAKQKGELSIGQRVRLAREEAGMSQGALARAVKVSQQTVQELESGRSQGTKHILKFAAALDQDPAWLESGAGQMRRRDADLTKAGVQTPATQARLLKSVRVVGAVQAGSWVETLEWPPYDQYDIPLPISDAFKGFTVQGLEVRGPSMNELYPHGSIVICVPFIELGRDPRHGERVIALRLRPGECEATVKEFRVDQDGKARLWPRSTHPDFQSPILANSRDSDNDLRIAYLVIGSYRSET